MQAAILPITAGWFWIQQGYRLFLRQPLALFFWGMTLAVLIMASYLLPILGQVILIAAMPSLTFMTLNACRHVTNGQIMRLPMWLAPLRPVRGRLVKLGLVYLACCLAGGFLAVIPFMGQLMDAVGAGVNPLVIDAPISALDVQALSQAMVGPIVLFFLLYVVISALFWHAPALMGWHGLSLSRALFFSMVACWRNKWPFLLYGLSWGAIFFAVQSLSDVLFNAGMSPAVVQWLLTPVNIVVVTILYCSFYPSYVSVFGAAGDRT